MDVSVPPETFRKHVDTSLTYINCGLKQMTRLFLVEDLVDSLKVSRRPLGLQGAHSPSIDPQWILWNSFSAESQ